MTKTKETVAQLRERAGQAGIDVPERATRAQIVALLEPVHSTVPSESAGTQEDAGAPSEPRQPGSPGERRAIERFTNRGDWEDPFSGLVVGYESDVCVESGARRDGDEAYLPDEG